jgi:hypothetical protein
VFLQLAKSDLVNQMFDKEAEELKMINEFISNSKTRDDKDLMTLVREKK